MKYDGAMDPRALCFGGIGLFAIAIAIAIAVSGCSSDTCRPHGSATCRQFAEDAPGMITGFEVTTVTGGDSSDATVNFCIEQKGGGFETCDEMATSGDDFNAGATDTFTLDIDLPTRELESFSIVNRGGAVFGNDEWEMVGLRVVALFDTDERFILYEEPRIVCGGSLDEGDRYFPMACW
jgi:hypothetical protein